MEQHTQTRTHKRHTAATTYRSFINPKFAYKIQTNGTTRKSHMRPQR